MTTLGFLGKIGTTELLLILGLGLVIFGPSKLPQLGKSLGDTLRNFKEGAGIDEKKGTSPEKEEK